MKRWIAAATAVLMSVCVTACNFTQTDSTYIKQKGTLTVGIIHNAPMAYEETSGSGNWIGFDPDTARKFAEHLGVEIRLTVIDPADCTAKLEDKTVDAVWGYTITDDEEAPALSVSEPYGTGAQVVVMKEAIAADHTTADTLDTLRFTATEKSAGAKALETRNITYTACDTQAKALMHVAAGNADACVISAATANAMIGEGTAYPTLVTGPELSKETYGVAFRGDSDLLRTFNEFWESACDEGTIASIADTYGVDILSE